MSKIWIASFPEGFYWPDCNDSHDEFIFYHLASGELLIINKLGKFLLDSIYKQAYMEKELVLLVCQYFEIDCDNDISNAIHSTLNRFNTLGLILNE